MSKVLYDPKSLDAPHRATVFDIDFTGGGDAVDVTDAKALSKFSAWQEHHPELGFTVLEDEPEAPAGLRAVHRGRGVYAVVDGSTVLDQLAAMTKEDADAFNALSDEDKAAFVAKPADVTT